MKFYFIFFIHIDLFIKSEMMLGAGDFYKAQWK